MKAIIICVSFLVVSGFIAPGSPGNNEWKAPPEADKLVNPLKGQAAATAEGKKTFVQLCSMCHGDKGKGDGVAGLALNPRPANYTLEKTQMQSDGVFFWKMSEGRPPMASYKTILSETQRWQLVNYIRELGMNGSKKLLTEKK